MGEIPWFKVDDRLHSSRKVLSIRRSLRLEAMGLWVMCGSWAAGEGLDGFVPDYMVEEFGGRPELVDALVKAGLWLEVDEGTAFNAWTEYNPDSGTIQAGRDAKAEGAKHANHKRWHVKRRTKVPGCEWCFPSVSDTDQIPDQITDNDPNPPDPTRPDPTHESSKEDSNYSSEITDVIRPDVEHLLDVLDEEISKNGGKVKPRVKRNRDAARLMIDRDKYPVDEIEKAIRWCQADEFWRSNILSMSKLREKYERLRLDSMRQKKQVGQVRPDRTQNEMGALAILMAREVGSEHDGGFKALDRGQQV